MATSPEKGDLLTALARSFNGGADANEHLPLGRTPLMAASRTGNVDAMKVLLDHGAEVNTKETLRGTTALMWAIPDLEKVRLLMPTDPQREFAPAEGLNLAGIDSRILKSYTEQQKQR